MVRTGLTAFGGFGHYYSKASLSCYQIRGGKRLYAGSLNTSQSGRPCWMWQNPGPMGNNYINGEYPFDFNNVQAAKNYCRSFPSDKHNNIWCYNANYNKGGDSARWDDCAVPRCQDIY
ncbi:muscle, skeletal receptor tyrosine-protein kinase [Elysia marginata]|uniref:Muscle, skeletal receptor tyrosine-protein kinase n=1 Tax=Elysia marginata TaxID=1093978 RepID=A0AAV4FWA7_9GAST|nr:muscle, skeletal receptor tyrosine-protein kinase [Elysia marginata]